MLYWLQQVLDKFFKAVLCPHASLSGESVKLWRSEHPHVPWEDKMLSLLKFSSETEPK